MTKAQQEIKLAEQEGSRKDYPPAYFLSIELENILCFKNRQKLDLSDANGFPSQWTVILGDNGVGKTTLLRSLASMEPKPTNVSSSTETGRILATVRIKTSNSFAEEILPKLQIDFFNSLEEKQTSHSLRPEIKTQFMYGSKLNSWKEISNDQAIKILSYLQKDYLEMLASSSMFLVSFGAEELLGLRCYGYGANRRMGETSLSEGLSADSCDSLFSDDAALINAEEWLLQADYAVARSAPENTARLKKRFHLIQETLKKLLPDVSDIRITLADNNIPRPTAEFLTPYGWVPLKSLSLGYKTVIAWIVDLAARLIERYPNSADPLAEPAVVLVDEIDLHLHPKWQRTIMSFLTERFPNTQFIVTAHSPLVVQAAKNANIVLLRREGDRVVIDNDPEIIDNWRVEQVLSSVFELPSPHSPDIAPLIERRRKLLAKSKLTAKDERELKKLEAQIGTIPTAESPEDIRAMDIIRKAAKLLENS
jgi:predicted ATP-binding protein involved in virulence